ncbi:hypothetical protein [Phenylobacterium sp.]|uniref:hypothetical protein n=1 Tax=Phenylobacterium sp. TaxID=1871053 RepID=UPI0025E4A879|nr:hypothetical protein [Phenylobacterium sp.]
MLAMFAAMTMAAATPDPTALRPKVFLLQPPAGVIACKPQGRYQADWADPALAVRDGRVTLQRLDRLPKPNHEKAVMRTLGGCAVPVVVNYAVGR